MSGSRGHRWCGGVIAAWAALLCACHGGDESRQRPPTPVRIAVVARADVPVTFTASGVVEPLQSVAVISQVTGVIQQVAFHEGDYVKAGQVLFQIDPRPLQADVDRARAQMARDEAQADAALKDDARYQELVDKGYVTRSQADQIHANALASRATVVADSAALRSTQLALANATIRSPLPGRTGSLLVREGNLAAPNAGALVIINQIQPVLARFPMPQQQFDTVQRQVALHALRVTASGSDSTRASEVGTLDFLNNAVDSLTGTVSAKARFPNTGQLLWPGELVTLEVEVQTDRGALTIPTGAVQLGQQGSYVWEIGANQAAEQRTITEGRVVGEVTIVTAGLKDGERVVVDGQSRLNPGAKVAIQGEGGETGGGRGGGAGEPTSGRGGRGGRAGAGQSGT